MNSFSDGIFEFGRFRLDTVKRTLLHDGQPVVLAPKAVDMLIVLVQHQGAVLEKDRLMELLWPDSVVEEANLPLNVSALRKALGESPGERKYIITIPGKGYKFAAEVRPVSRADDSLIVERFSRSTVVIEETSRGKAEETSSQDRDQPSPGPSPSRRRQLIALGLVAAATAAIAFYGVRAKNATARGSSVRSLAVLPFVTLGDGGDEPLGIGLTDVLITRLSGLKTILIRPTSSVLRYVSTQKGAVEIGQELGVESVLEGSVQKSEGRIRLTVRLLRVSDGLALWASKFDASPSDIFTIEDAISAQVSEKIVSHLTSEERQALTRHDTENPEAHTLYLKGRYQLEKRTPEGGRKALEFLRQAIKLDSNSALSYTGLAEAYMTLAVTGGLEPNQSFPFMRQAASRALEITPLLAEAHCMLAMTKFWHEWDYAGAERDFKRAIEINPNLAQAHELYGHLLSNLGRHEDALRESSQALEIDPMSLIFNALRGQMLMFAGENDEAMAQLHKTIEFEPDFWISHLILGKVYGQKGMYDHAIAEYQKARSLSPNSSESTSYLGYTYAVMKRRREALDALKALKEMSEKSYVAPKGIALIYAGLGEKDQMFAWLEKAYEGRDIGLTFIKVDPRWDPYRSDPRFVDLTRRVGF